MNTEWSDDKWITDLQSEDEAVVIKAMHHACPCPGSAELYETYTTLLHSLKKDSRPAVRKVALHLETDALEQLAIADERSNGWVRNKPGGNGRRRNRRSAHRGHGAA